MVASREGTPQATELGTPGRPAPTGRVDAPVLLLMVVAVLAAAVIGFWIGGGFAAEPGADVAARVIEAWTTADDEMIEEVYASEVVMSIDGETLAADRDALASTIRSAVDGLGNTYAHVGPVSSYETASGELLVAGIVEVTGPGHPDGDPLVGYYRVRDDQVIRHVFWQVPQS